MFGFCKKCDDFRGDGGLEWTAIVKRGKMYCEKCGSEMEVLEWWGERRDRIRYAGMRAFS